MSFPRAPFRARGGALRRRRGMAVAVAKRRRVGGGLGSERTREALVGYGFVALPMAFFLLFFIFPIGYAFYISRYDWQIFKGPFVGWDNYRPLYHDSVFWSHAVRNTLVYTVTRRPSADGARPFARGCRQPGDPVPDVLPCGVLLPVACASAAIAAIATYILASDGLFNTILDHLGYDHQRLVRAAEHRPAVDHRPQCLDDIGTMMLFYLASLQAIPIEVYEAAAIDGAGAWRTFRKITFPLLKPGHFFVAVVSIIGALQLFDQSFIIGGASGGPNYSTITVVLYLYNQAIGNIKFGYAAAVGRRPLRVHLHGDVDPATPLREGRGGLMADEQLPPLQQSSPSASSHWRVRARARPRTPKAFPAASGPTGSGRF